MAGFKTASPRVLVTGASGFLGGHLCRVAVERGFEVVGTVHTRGLALASAEAATVEVVRLELREPEAIAALVQRVRPDLVVHAAAMAHPDDCARDPDAAARVNVEGSRLLARAAREHGAQFAYLSTDLVYDGERSSYVETDEASPLGVYGRTKLAAEAAVRHETRGEAFIARLALLYGPPLPGASSFVQPWVAAFGAGAPVRAFHDQVRCPIWVDDACDVLLRAPRGGLAGTFHLAGPEAITREAFARALARAMGVEETLVVPTSQDEVGFPDPRPKRCVLDVSRLRAGLVGFAPVTPVEGLARLVGA